jgi:hypothetical protein
MENFASRFFSMQITVKYYISHQEVMPTMCDLKIIATMTTNFASLQTQGLQTVGQRKIHMR